VGLKAVLFQREQEAKRFKVTGEARPRVPTLLLLYCRSRAVTPALVRECVTRCRTDSWSIDVMRACAQTRKKAKETVWTKQNKGLADRSRRDEEALRAEQKTTENVEAKLQEKARLYDQFSTRSFARALARNDVTWTCRC
jgi:hypothetical protein